MSVATLDSSKTPEAQQTRSRVTRFLTHPLLWLLLITALGGAFRFYKLDSPAAWCDESYTYRRVIGSRDDLFKTLQEQGFPPLHYLTLWKIKSWHALDVWTLRLFPAICGTLMIPAMYFVARQMFKARTALLVALFISCSAWFMSFSRDAKMYSPLWLFVVLNAGCFLWWIRTRLVTAWLAWMAAGCAMVGLHGLGFGLLAIQPIWLLTARRNHWVQGLMFVIGVAVISAGPIMYYKHNNQWREGAGTQWVEERNRGIPLSHLVNDTLSAYLFNYSWIQEKSFPKIPLIILKSAAWALGITKILLLLGMFPWRRFSFRESSENPASEKSGLVEPLRIDEKPVEGIRAYWWQSLLWIGLWIGLPMYAIYRASIPSADGVWDWWNASLDLIRGIGTGEGTAFWERSLPMVTVLGIAIALAGALMIHRWVFRGAWMALCAIGFSLLIWSFFKSGFSDPIASFARFKDLLWSKWICWSILPLTLAVAFHASGHHVRERLIKLAMLLLVLAIWIGLLWVVEQAYPGPWKRNIWMPRYLGVISPAILLATAVLFSRLPTRPLRWGAIVLFLALNLTQAYARVNVSTEPPLDRMARDVVAAQGDNAAVVTLTPRIGMGHMGPGFATNEPHDLTWQMYLIETLKKPGVLFTPFTMPRIFQDVKIVDYDVPRFVATHLKSKPTAERMILWRKDDGSEASEPLLKELKDWKLERVENYVVRVQASWGEIYKLSRREYVKR